MKNRKWKRKNSELFVLRKENKRLRDTIKRREDRLVDILKRLRIKRELLNECHRRFTEYEMDVDDTAPTHHRKFMEKLKANV